MNENSKFKELDPEVLHAARQEPKVEEASNVVRQALLEIHIYSSSHKDGASLEKSVEALVAAGALCPEIAVRLANYRATFHGIPSRISQDIAVLDVVPTNRTPPVRVVGFADGHAALVAVDKQTAVA